MRVLVLSLALLWITAAGPTAHAQSLADRVLATPTEIVRMSFPAREGVCGDGADYRFRGRLEFRGRSDANWQYECENGPVRVQIEKDGDRIAAVRTYVGGAWRPRAEVTDLGDVPPREARDWLLDVAAAEAPSVAEDAIMPAVIADAPDPWPRLLDLGRDRALDLSVRERAIFWVGESAAREATRGLAQIVDNDAENTAVQKAAVFALSQRDDPERVEQLMQVAQTHSNPEVVKAAFFWLADSADERAMDFFEEVLLVTE
jgi:hypothetical protein